MSCYLNFDKNQQHKPKRGRQQFCSILQRDRGYVIAFYFHFALPSIGCRCVEELKWIPTHQKKWIQYGKLNENKRNLQKSLERKMQKLGHRSLHLLQKQTAPHMQKMLEHNRRKRHRMVTTPPNCSRITSSALTAAPSLSPQNRERLFLPRKRMWF